MSTFLMGLDVGGRSVSCSLVNVESGDVICATRPWGPIPVPEAGFFAFGCDTDRCWRMVEEVAREALRKAGAAPGQVAGVATTGMRFSLVVMGLDGEVLLTSPNRDARAAGEGMMLAEEHGDLFNRRTGHWPSPIFMAPRLQALATRDPGIFAQARCAFSLNDRLAFRLTGEIATDPSQAGETLLFDLETRDWAWDLIDMLALPRHLFPPVRPSGALLGPLTQRAAEALGLLAGTPVAVGGADTQCGLLGTGVTEPAQLAVIAGSTSPLQLVTARPHVDPEARLWAGHHVVPGLWVMESNAGAMGDSLDWFAGVLCLDSPDPTARFMAVAARSAPGAGGIVSSLGAEVMNAQNLSLPMGTLSLTHLSAMDDATARGERRGNLYRAVLEGMAFAVRANADRLLSLAGTPATDIRMAGGMTRSDLWTQMVCDVLGRPISVSTVPGASGLGAAICAGVGAGVFADLHHGARALVRLRRLAPETERAQVYDDLYAHWTHLQQVRAPADAVAADIALQAMMDRPTAQPTAQPVAPPLRILVTADMDELSLDDLRRLGEVTYSSYRDALRLLTGDELAEEVQGFQVLVTEVDIVDGEALDRLPDLRVIAACRGRAVNVDLAACTALGIPVLYAPGRNAEAVADLALAFMLMLSRRLVEANAFLRIPGGEAGDHGRMGRAHSEFRGHELGNKTVGLVGLGAVGRAVARRLRPFGARIIGHDPFVDAHAIHLLDAEPATLDEVLATSDIVSLHAPVTAATQGMIGSREFARMKPGALLINTARAALVQEDALLEALCSGHLGGAGLDVFAVEPPGADYPLLALPNVIATPHVGGNTVEVAAHQGRMIADDLRRMVSGLPPEHVLNPETLADFAWRGTRPRRGAGTRAVPADASRPAVTDLLLDSAAQTPSGTRPAEVGGPFAAPAETVGASAVPAEGCGPSAVVPTTLRHQMERVLQLFVHHAGQDAALHEFARTRCVISHYVVTDLQLEFHIGFRDGRVVAGAGAPAQPAEVKLKAKAEILDAILTGRLNGNKAAMTGKLSFSGDVRQAMGMQKIQGDMVRLYSAARDEAGGIDFTAAGTAATFGAAAAAPVSVVAGGSPGLEAAIVSASRLGTPADRALRDELVLVTEELFAAQLITATGGNVSARILNTAEAWISPSLLYKGGLSAEMMVRIDLDGNALDPNAPAPSSERLLHGEIYRARPDVQAVVHAHATYATILGLTGLPFLPVTTEAAFLGDLPQVPFIMPGSSELAVAVRQALGDGVAVLMRNHGLVVAAGSLRQAANTAEVIERVSQLIWSCYAAGKKSQTLPKHMLSTLRDIGRMMA